MLVPLFASRKAAGNDAFRRKAYQTTVLYFDAFNLCRTRNKPESAGYDVFSKKTLIRSEGSVALINAH